MKQFVIVALVVCLVGGVVANDCEGVNNDFAPDTTDCNKYHFCVNNTIEKTHTCPSDQLYDFERKVCNYAYLVTNCKAAKPVTCPPTGTETVLVPGDCVKFFLCVDGKQYPRQCPEGTLVDTTTRLCQLPQNSDCNDCPLVFNPEKLEWRPDRKDCTKYFLCLDKAERKPYS